eukprot:19759-Heterococcus_DN1.PRE.1
MLSASCCTAACILRCTALLRACNCSEEGTARAHLKNHKLSSAIEKILQTTAAVAVCYYNNRRKHCTGAEPQSSRCKCAICGALHSHYKRNSIASKPACDHSTTAEKQSHSSYSGVPFRRRMCVVRLRAWASTAAIVRAGVYDKYNVHSDGANVSNAAVLAHLWPIMAMPMQLAYSCLQLHNLAAVQLYDEASLTLVREYSAAAAKSVVAFRLSLLLASCINDWGMHYSMPSSTSVTQAPRCCCHVCHCHSAASGTTLQRLVAR